MIFQHSDYPGNGMTIAEYRRQQFRRISVRPSSDHLRRMTDETLAELDRRKEQGVKPERQWTLDLETKGTPCFAELFGF
jgi:hypothetical protein